MDQAIITTTAPATPGETSSLPISSLTELDSADRAILAGWKSNGKTPGASAAPAVNDKEQTSELEADDKNDEDEQSNEGNDEGEQQHTDPENADSEGEDDSTDKEEDDQDPEGKKTGIQKRIDKLTAQKAQLREARDEAIEERDAFKAELETLRTRLTSAPMALVPIPEDPMSDLTSPTDVDARMQKAQATIDWCKANRKGASVPKAEGSEEMVELDADDISELREREEEILSKHGPKRKEYLATFAKGTEIARAAYPTIFQTGHKDQEYAKAFMKMIPGFARHPMHELLIGDALIGAQIRHGKAIVVRKDGTEQKPANGAAAGAAAGQKKPAVKAPLSSQSSSPASKQSGSKPDTTALRQKALQSGQMEDVERSLAARFG